MLLWQGLKNLTRSAIEVIRRLMQIDNDYYPEVCFRLIQNENFIMLLNESNFKLKLCIKTGLSCVKHEKLIDGELGE